MNKYIRLSVEACVSLTLLLTTNTAQADTVFFDDFQDRPSVPAELPVIQTTATGSKGDVADIGRMWDSRSEANNVDVVADPLGPRDSLVLQGNFEGSGGNGEIDGDLLHPIFFDGASISADFYLGPNGNNANDVTIRIRPQDGAGTGGIQFNVNGSVSGAGNGWTVDHFGTEIWQSASWSYTSTGNPDEYEVALTITDIDTGDSFSDTSIFTAAAGTDGNSFTEVNPLFRGNSDHYAYVDNLQVDGNVAPEPPPPPAPPLLLVHYTFDDASGGVVPDQSTNGYDGSLAGDATLTGPNGGVVGSALELDGDDDFLNAGDIDFLDTPGQFTVSMWFNRRIEPLSDTNHGTNNVLIAQTSDGSNDNLEIGSIVTDMQIYLDTGGGGGNSIVPADVTEDFWHHMVFSYDRDEPVEAMMYLDGELIMENDQWGRNLDSSAASPLTFGAARPDQDDPWGELDGFIDEVQIYSRAITPEEVEQLLNDPGSTLVGDLGRSLQAGDANMDLEFNQLDLVQVQIAAKYLTGQPATWGEGDWDAAPGGQPDDPPAGDGFFNQLDIVAALGAGKYLTGPYGAINPGGSLDDVQTSIVYDANTGEVSVDAPADSEVTSINIDSAAGIFTGDAAANLGGSFDNDADNNIFKATFGSSFASLSFGNVAQAGLSEGFVAGDLTVVGSLAGGGDLGAVDLVYIPEPSAVLLLTLGVVGLLAVRRRR